MCSAFQQLNHNKHIQSTCQRQYFDNQRTLFEPRPIITPKARYVELPTIPGSLHAQGKDSLCGHIKHFIGIPNFHYTFEKTRIPVRHDPPDWSIQIVVPERLRATILYIALHPTLAIDINERRMYYSLQKHFHLPNMATYAYNTVWSCLKNPKMGTKFRHERKLELLPRSAPLEFVVIETLESLLRIKYTNQFAVIITDRYSKLASAVRTSKAISTQVANIFFSNLLIPYRIPDTILSKAESSSPATFHIHMLIPESGEAHNYSISPPNKRAG